MTNGEADSESNEEDSDRNDNEPSDTTYLENDNADVEDTESQKSSWRLTEQKKVSSDGVVELQSYAIIPGGKKGQSALGKRKCLLEPLQGNVILAANHALDGKYYAYKDKVAVEAKSIQI
jgi:hypothetical protein